MDSFFMNVGLFACILLAISFVISFIFFVIAYYDELHSYKKRVNLLEGKVHQLEFEQLKKDALEQVTNPPGYK